MRLLILSLSGSPASSTVVLPPSRLLAARLLISVTLDASSRSMLSKTAHLKVVQKSTAAERQRRDDVVTRRSIVPSHKVPAPPVLHQCPSCRQPQTKIKRGLGDGKCVSRNFICSRLECAVGIDVSKLATWVTD